MSRNVQNNKRTSVPWSWLRRVQVSWNHHKTDWNHPGSYTESKPDYLAGITSQCKCRHFEKLHTDMYIYTCINDDVPRWEPCTFQVCIDTSSGDFEILYTSMTHIHNYINHHHSKVSSAATSRIAITFSKALSRMYALFARSLGILSLIFYSETHSWIKVELVVNCTTTVGLSAGQGYTCSGMYGTSTGPSTGLEASLWSTA